LMKICIELQVDMKLINCLFFCAFLFTNFFVNSQEVKYNEGCERNNSDLHTILLLGGENKITELSVNNQKIDCILDSSTGASEAIYFISNDTLKNEIFIGSDIHKSIIYDTNYDYLYIWLSKKEVLFEFSNCHIFLE